MQAFSGRLPSPRGSFCSQTHFCNQQIVLQIVSSQHCNTFFSNLSSKRCVINSTTSKIHKKDSVFHILSADHEPSFGPEARKHSLIIAIPDYHKSCHCALIMFVSVIARYMNAKCIFFLEQQASIFIWRQLRLCLWCDVVTHSPCPLCLRRWNGKTWSVESQQWYWGKAKLVWYPKTAW